MARENSFFLLRYEIQNTGMMKEGQCQSPHSFPELHDNDVLPVRSLSYLGGATAAGVNPL